MSEFVPSVQTPCYKIMKGDYGYASFTSRRSLFCCAVEEIGALSWDAGSKIPLDVGRELIRLFLKNVSVSSQNINTPGMVHINFVKRNGELEVTTPEWFELFQEAGFIQFVPTFENHVHPGNQIIQLVRFITRG